MSENLGHIRPRLLYDHGNSRLHETAGYKHPNFDLESVKAFQKVIMEKKTPPPTSAPDVPAPKTSVRESQSVPLANKEKHPSAILDNSAPGDSSPTSPKTQLEMNSHGDDGSKVPEDPDGELGNKF